MNTKQQAELAKALGHEARLSMVLALFKHGERDVSELMKSSQLSQSSTSQHLKVLRDAGIVETERKGTSVLYSLNRENYYFSIIEEFAKTGSIVA